MDPKTRKAALKQLANDYHDRMQRSEKNDKRTVDEPVLDPEFEMRRRYFEMIGKKPTAAGIAAWNRDWAETMKDVNLRAKKGGVRKAR